MSKSPPAYRFSSKLSLTVLRRYDSDFSFDKLKQKYR